MRRQGGGGGHRGLVKCHGCVSNVKKIQSREIREERVTREYIMRSECN